jgi:hypothetical protein
MPRTPDRRRPRNITGGPLATRRWASMTHEPIERQPELHCPTDGDEAQGISFHGSRTEAMPSFGADTPC